MTKRWAEYFWNTRHLIRPASVAGVAISVHCYIVVSVRPLRRSGTCRWNTSGLPGHLGSAGVVVPVVATGRHVLFSLDIYPVQTLTWIQIFILWHHCSELISRTGLWFVHIMNYALWSCEYFCNYVSNELLCHSCMSTIILCSWRSCSEHCAVDWNIMKTFNMYIFLLLCWVENKEILNPEILSPQEHSQIFSAYRFFV